MREIPADGPPLFPSARSLGRRANQAASGADPRLSDARLTVDVNGTEVGLRRRLDLIAGTNVTLSSVDNATDDTVEVTIDSTGGGGGAPTGAHYVVTQLNGSLTNEQLLTDTSSITWDLSTPGVVTADVVTGSLPGTICAGDDGRLSDMRTADAIYETSGPDILVMTGVADGTYLKRSGMTIVGDTPPGGSGADLYVIRKLVALRL